MNFRTTFILLAVLVGVGIVLLFTRGSDEKAADMTVEPKLLNLNAGDVTRLSFTSDDGTKISVEKADGKWRLTEPVKASADDADVNALVGSLAELDSRGRIDAGPAVGLDQPRFKVEVGTKDNKTIKLNVGSKSAAGNNLYIQRDGQKQADVVSAELYDNLDKPARQWRREKLVDVGAPQITQLRIATTQESYSLEKQGDEWKVSAPTSMPADMAAVTDLTMAVTNLRAQDFVDAPADQTRRFGLDQPVMTITFSTAAPSTQPSTSQPALTTIQFGRFDDLLKRNVYASISTEPGVMKVAAASMDAFHKKPIDLRERKVLNIDADKVTKLTIVTDKPPTTQPTTREAVQQTLVLERNKTVVAAPATMAATTQAATQPVEPPAKWLMASKDGAEAEDSKVLQLLGDLHPLRADKFVEIVPLVMLTDTYTLRVETTDAVHEIRMSDPGAGKPVIASYNGLSFEIPRSVLNHLEGNFAKGAEPAMPEMPPGMPPGMPRGFPMSQ